MRVSMANGWAPPACGSFSNGEVEDYTVVIAPWRSRLIRVPRFRGRLEARRSWGIASYCSCIDSTNRSTLPSGL